MAQTPTKYAYPTGQDPFRPHSDMKRLAESVTGIVPVSDRVEADGIASAINPTRENPLFVHRSDTNQTEINTGNGWRVIPTEGEWDEGIMLRNPALYEWAQHGAKPAIQRVGNWVYVRGRYRRTPGTDFGTSAEGYWLAQIPVELRPRETHRFTGSTARGGGALTTVQFEVSGRQGSTPGELRAWLNGTAAWVGLDGACWSLD